MMDGREEDSEPLLLAVAVVKEILPEIPQNALDKLPPIKLSFKFSLDPKCVNMLRNHPIGMPAGTLTVSAYGTIYRGGMKFGISVRRILPCQQPLLLLPIGMRWSVQLKQDFNPDTMDDDGGQNNVDGGQRQPGRNNENNGGKYGRAFWGPTSTWQKSSTLEIPWQDLRNFDLEREVECQWEVEVEAYTPNYLLNFENRSTVLFHLITHALREQGEEMQKQGTELVEHRDELGEQFKKLES